ncbi:helix-turn-helix domain-containing protein [Escherichia coli]
MNCRQVADLFGVTARTIQEWSKNIETFPLPVSPEGAQLRFVREEIEAYFASRCGRK